MVAAAAASLAAVGASAAALVFPRPWHWLEAALKALVPKRLLW